MSRRFALARWRPRLASRLRERARQRGTLAELRTVPSPTSQEVEVADALGSRDAELSAVSRRDADERDDAGGDAAPRGPAAREGVRHHRRHARRGAGRDGRARRRRRAERDRRGDVAGSPPTIARSRPRNAESDEEFERRTTGKFELVAPATHSDSTCPGADGLRAAGPLEAIAIYERLLTEYPNYERRDQVLYQMARAYDELGRTEEAMDVMQRLVGEFGYSTLQRRGAVPPRRVLLHATQVPRRRGRVRDDRRQERALGVLRARALQARLVALQAGLLRGSAASLHGAARLQAVGRLRLRSAARGRGRAPRRGHVPRHQLELLEPRWSRGARPSTTRPTAAAATRTASTRTSASSTSTSCATTTRRPSTTRSSSAIRTIASSPDFSMRVIGIYEAGDFPKLVVESKKVVRDQVRLAERVLAALRLGRAARGAERI